jgi:Fe-S-cluster containining protein
MADDLIVSLPRIRRYARQNEADDLRVGAALKAGGQLSNGQLDALVRETAGEIAARIDCTTCAACCKNRQIAVDDADIRRLASAQNLSVAEFARRYVEKSPDGGQHFATIPCPFLADDNRCTVYAHRPQACRDFPYFDAPGFRTRVFLTIENSAACPIAFHTWQALKRQLRSHRR